MTLPKIYCQQPTTGKPEQTITDRLLSNLPADFRKTVYKYKLNQAETRFAALLESGQCIVWNIDTGAKVAKFLLVDPAAVPSITGLELDPGNDHVIAWTGWFLASIQSSEWTLVRRSTAFQCIWEGLCDAFMSRQTR